MKDLMKKHINLVPNAVKDLFSNDLLADKFFIEKSFPLFNVSEDKEQYNLELSLPGIEKENIKVKREDNVLTISYKKEYNEEEKSKNYHRREFKSESFEKTLTLPENVKYEEIHSEYKNGLLKIILPKKVVEHEGSKGVEIEVK